MAQDVCKRDLAMAQLNSQSASEIAAVIAGGSPATSMVGRAALEVSRAVGLDQDGAITIGPPGNTAKVAEEAESQDDIQRLQAFAGGADVLRSAELSAKCVASGIISRGYFCEITGRQHYPRLE